MRRGECSSPKEENMQNIRGKKEQFVLIPRSSFKWLEERVKGGSGTAKTQIIKGVGRMQNFLAGKGSL